MNHAKQGKVYDYIKQTLRQAFLEPNDILGASKIEVAILWIISIVMIVGLYIVF